MAATVEAPAPLPSANAKPAPRVLIVEDDVDIRETLGDLLQTEGYETAAAGNGLEALAAARRARPDLIVLDLMMPVMDGWQFRSEQRQDPALAAIPVIVISASAGSRAIDADTYLEKPFSLDRLVEAVARLRRS
jgi:CheY-like chemotaxis protein